MRITEQFKIPYPKPASAKVAWNRRYGMNAYYSGKHWAQRKKDAEVWHWMTTAAMRKAKCRTTPFDKPVIVRFYWNDNLDVDNHAVMGKMIVDAMKGLIIHDDSRRYLVGVSHYFHDEDYILVTVREADSE